MIIKDPSLPRRKVVDLFRQIGVETRPIVAGNFLHNPVIKYFNYSVHSELKNADLLHNQGLFIGNNPNDLQEVTDDLQLLNNKIAVNSVSAI